MKAKLTWEITYEPDDEESEDLNARNIHTLLEWIVNEAFGNGLVSGDFDFVVADHKFRIDVDEA